ncbi:acidic mammalian chitinase-like [Mytilus edulis]|uniref:acidic mammalian chitinase-like n=1 Tax=Mytilus edulis TaxID=6550 RepID=UPI0039F11733
MGMASYGRSFILNNTSETGLGAPSSGQGTAGSTTREKGFLSYYEICYDIMYQNWTEIWLDEQKVPYAYHDNQWISFETPKSIAIKTKYIMDNGLGGGMMWALDLDDFHGVCGQGKNPLITMKDVFSGKPGLDFVPTALPVVVG